MYLNQSMILEAINKLGAIHPFYMLTYLVCKRDAMPVGQTFNYDISTKEKEFLDLYFKPVDESKHYFKISRLGRKEQFWIDDKYASSTAQSYRTRGLLSEAFIHERNTKQWGWQTNFLQILRKKLDQDQVEAIPAIYLAIWLYRGERWAKANLSLVLDTFFPSSSFFCG